MNTILLVHDDAVGLAFVRYVLEHNGYLVLTANAVNRVRISLTRAGATLLPDAIVTTPPLAPAVAAEVVAADAATAPILVLGTVQARLPAACHPLPDAQPTELLLCIQALLGNGNAATASKVHAPPVNTPVNILGSLRIDPAAHQAWIHDRKLALTELAFRLLHFLATHPNRVFSRAQLLDFVWGTGVCIEARAVDAQVYRLRNELSRVGHGDLIEAVRGAGYRFTDARALHAANDARVPSQPSLQQQPRAAWGAA